MNARPLALMLLAMATPAYAHSEEILLFPVGQVAALAVTIVATTTLLRSIPGFVRWSGFLVALATCIPFWFIPGSYFPEYLRHTAWGNFISGLVPPLVIGGVVSYIVWRIKFQKATSNPAFNQHAPKRRSG